MDDPKKQPPVTELKDEDLPQNGNLPHDDQTTQEGGGKADEAASDQPETEDTKPEVPNEEAGVQAEFFYIDREEKYGKQGFHCAIDAINDPRPEFRRLLDKLRNRRDEAISEVNTAKDNRLSRIDDKVLSLGVKIDIARDEIEEYNQQYDSLLENRDAVRGKLRDKQKVLQEQYRELGEEENQLISERITKSADEIQSIVEANKKIYQVDHSNKETATDVKALREIKDQIKAKLDAVQKQIESFSAAGLSSGSIGFLRRASYAGVLAAGWFFTIFAMYANGGNPGQGFVFDSQDYFSQAIKRLFTIRDGTLTGADWSDLLFGIGLLIGTLGVVTAIAYYGHQFLHQTMEKRIKSRIRARSRRGALSLNASVEARGFLSFWIQVLPILFLLGVLLVCAIVLGLGNETTMNQAGMYAASLTFGSSIALAFGGLMTMYIAKIVEPRLAKEEAGNRRKKSIMLKNWEMSLAFFLFLLSSVILLFVDSTNSSKWMSGLILTGFVSISLSSAFALAYANRYGGLIFLSRVFQEQYMSVSIQIENLCNPSLLYELSEDGIKFRKKVQFLQDQLMDLVESKNIHALKVVQEEHPKHEAKKEKENQTTFLDRVKDGASAIFFQVRQVFSRQKSGPKQSNAIHIPPPDIDPYVASQPSPTTRIGSSTQDYFPTFRKVIADLEEEIAKLKAKETSLSLELTAIRKRNSNFEIARSNRIKRWEQAIYDLRRVRAKEQLFWLEKLETVQYRFALYENGLRDGYMLGIWCRENGISPTQKFYPQLYV